MCVSIISDHLCYFIDTYFQTLMSEAIKYHKKAIKLTNFLWPVYEDLLSCKLVPHSHLSLTLPVCGPFVSFLGFLEEPSLSSDCTFDFTLSVLMSSVL